MPVFFTFSNPPFPCQWSLREDASGKQQRLPSSCSLPPQDPAGRLPCASTQWMPCTGCSRGEAGPTVLPCVPGGIPAAARGAEQVPGHCHHGYLHIHGTSHTGSTAGLEGGHSGANLPQKPVPSGRLALAAVPGAGERLAQFTQQTRRGGWLQPMKKLRRDRKRTA